MSNTVIQLSGIDKFYNLYERNFVDRFKDTFLPGKKKRAREFQALKGINLEVKKGEILGLVGRNGAGKSTLLKVISGITMPSSGRVSVRGKIIPLLELGGGFNPDYTGTENFYFYASLLGMKKEEADELYPEVVAFAELEEFIDQPVRKYSSGMRARLAFAVSVNVDPDILILDEVLAVGDELFRRKCYLKMQEFFTGGKTILYVSNNAQSIIDLCTRAVLIHRGQLLLEGSPSLVVFQYRNLLNQPLGSDREKETMEKIIDLNGDAELKENFSKQIEESSLLDNVESYEEQETKERAYFVQDFESKTRKPYKKKNVDITDFYLKTPEGEDVNHLVWGEEYEVSFKAVFNEDVEDVRIGCAMLNEKVKDISASYFPEKNRPISLVRAGTELLFKTTFNAFLPPKIFGLSFQVLGETNRGNAVVSRLNEAILFRVLEKSPSYTQGEVEIFRKTRVETTIKTGSY